MLKGSSVFSHRGNEAELLQEQQSGQGAAFYRIEAGYEYRVPLRLFQEGSPVGIFITIVSCTLILQLLSQLHVSPHVNFLCPRLSMAHLILI